MLLVAAGLCLFAGPPKGGFMDQPPPPPPGSMPPPMGPRIFRPEWTLGMLNLAFGIIFGWVFAEKEATEARERLQAKAWPVGDMMALVELIADPRTVIVEGESAPGTLVTQELNSIEIEAEALSIPENLIVSVEGVAAGTPFTAADIPLPAGVNLISDPEALVVNVMAAPTAEQMDEEGAAPAADAPAADEAPAAE